jgi:hypothetical protein
MEGKMKQAFRETLAKKQSKNGKSSGSGDEGSVGSDSETQVTRSMSKDKGLSSTPIKDNSPGEVRKSPKLQTKVTEGRFSFFENF